MAEPYVKIVGSAPQLTEYIIPADKPSHFHSTWESPEEFSRHIRALDRKKAWEDAGWDGDRKFTGSDSMEDTLQLALNGWKDGADQCQRLRDRIVAQRPQSPQTIKYGIAGSVPSVPRAVAGNILNMRSIDMAKSRKKPILTLVCNMCSNWTINEQVISNRAAALAAVIDEIEAQGYACEVISTAVVSGGWRSKEKGNFMAATTVLVKPSDQPVDTARLAFALGHASFFRRMIFADWGSEPDMKKKLGSGLGTVGEYSASDEENRRGIYVVPAAGDNRKAFETEDLAATDGIDFLIQSFRQQGCPAFPTLTKEEKKALAEKKGKKKKDFIPDFDEW